MYDKHTEFGTQRIADKIHAILKERSINPHFFINYGMNNQQVYSVLRMGKTYRKDYRISTLINMLSILDIELSKLL